MPDKFAQLTQWIVDNVLMGDKTPNFGVEEICKMDCGKEGDVEDPTNNEVVDFLRAFAGIVAQETSSKEVGRAKKGGGPRVQAINNIAQWVQNNPKSTFLGIDPAPFAFKLALRVRKPQLIDQTSSRLCGPVAVLATFGKLDPVRFAQLGMDLLTNGQGLLGNLTLTPTEHIRHGFPKQKTSISSVDYLLLVSLRQCADVESLADMANVCNEMTTAGTVCQTLADAGYSDVQDHTFLDHGSIFDPGPWAIAQAEKVHGQKVFYNKPSPGAHDDNAIAENLCQAARELEAGRLVLISGHGDIAEKVRNASYKLGSASAVSRLLSGHWTAVRKIAIVGKKVRLRIITWGGRYEGELDRADLFARYNGYVSAKP
jgi:hypothetical protein